MRAKSFILIEQVRIICVDSIREEPNIPALRILEKQLFVITSQIRARKIWYRKRHTL